MDKDINKHHEELHMENAQTQEVLEDLAFYRTLVANVCMIGDPDSKNWVLIDTGVRNYANRIIAAAEKRFGSTPPKAIILTHAHFDHVGSAKELAKHWDVKIYIHPKEIDYVTRKKTFPPADPTVGGGMLSLLSPIFPQKPVNLKKFIEPLPADGKLPYLDDWKYIHTPGHSPGHIALYRERDKTLLSGDAVVTEKPESTLAVLIPLQKVYGPPAYFTPQWDLAEESVKVLAKLEPNVLLSGHGLPMEGEILRQQLHDLANNFREQAIPKHQKGH